MLRFFSNKTKNEIKKWDYLISLKGRKSHKTKKT